MANSETNINWMRWGKAVFIAVILTLILKNLIFATSIVEGESMSPTIEDGDRIIFNKLIYLIHKPNHHDIVIIQGPIKNYVKRVIALPGETIQMKNYVLYIDDKVSEEIFLTEDAHQRTANFGPIEVPINHYFVMGDNRAISKDSRNGLGYIHEKDIIGRSEVIYYPFSEWSFTR